MLNWGPNESVIFIEVTLFISEVMGDNGVCKSVWNAMQHKNRKMTKRMAVLKQN